MVGSRRMREGGENRTKNLKIFARARLIRHESIAGGSAAQTLVGECSPLPHIKF